MESQNSLTVVPVNQGTALLPALCARVLEIEVRPVYGRDGFEGEKPVYALRAGTTAAEKQRARDSLLALLEPCGTEFASREIIRLRGLTKMKEGDGASLSGAAYVAEVANYPADAVRAVCRDLGGRSTFFPSWAELKRELDRAIKPVRDAIDVIDGRGKVKSVADASREAFEKARDVNLARMVAKHGGAV